MFMLPSMLPKSMILQRGVNDHLHSMLKFFLQLYINDVRIKISFRYIKRKSVAEGFAFKCVSLCYNLLLLSKQQEEIMCYASFIVLLQFEVSQRFKSINAFPFELVIFSNNL